MDDYDDGNYGKELTEKERQEELEIFYYFWPLSSQDCQNGNCNCAMH